VIALRSYWKLARNNKTLCVSPAYCKTFCRNFRLISRISACKRPSYQTVESNRIYFFPEWKSFNFLKKTRGRQGRRQNYARGVGDEVQTKATREEITPPILDMGLGGYCRSSDKSSMFCRKTTRFDACFSAYKNLTGGFARVFPLDTPLVANETNKHNKQKVG